MAVAQKVGTEFLVDKRTAGHQNYPQIEGVANGGLMVKSADVSCTPAAQERD